MAAYACTALTKSVGVTSWSRGSKNRATSENTNLSCRAHAPPEGDRIELTAHMKAMMTRGAPEHVWVTFCNQNSWLQRGVGTSFTALCFKQGTVEEARPAGSKRAADNRTEFYRPRENDPRQPSRNTTPGARSTT